MPRLPGTFALTPRTLASAFDAACARLDSSRFATALWSRQLDVWSQDQETQRLVANRLGWLKAVEFVTPLVPRLRAFADSVRLDAFTDVVLLGMGGSSLAPEVLRQVFEPVAGAPRFHVLDSVDPDAVRRAMARARDTLFVLASKSGSTIEPNTMAEEARRRVTAEGHASWGARFVAITDPDTALHRRALSDGFREVFLNPADIGGRYSALSLFGMVPAALMGLDIDALLAGARRMETLCRLERAQDNPGLALGAMMAAGALNGRDKLTLHLPTRLESLGLWVEQLVAESTGKHGKGVVPVAGEPRDLLSGSDRLVVTVTMEGDSLTDTVQPTASHALLEMPVVEDIGAEFLRWEVATAAAGLLLDINPFDEPNVQQAKDATRVLLDHYQQQRQLPMPESHASVDGARLTLSEPAVADLTGRPAQSFLQVLTPTDYLGLLAYVPPDDAEWNRALQAFRAAVASRTKCATTIGIGPRYLHSTGQLHKGGANNGVFIILVAEAGEDLAVPNHAYSFGVLEAAQALGDFQSLERTGRRALLIRLPRRDLAALGRITDALVAGLS